MENMLYHWHGPFYEQGVTSKGSLKHTQLLEIPNLANALLPTSIAERYVPHYPYPGELPNNP